MSSTARSSVASHRHTWLMVGVGLGLLAALCSVLVPRHIADPQRQIVATVNGTPITREKYLNHLRALSADKKDAITSDDASYVLERIIEEELLVQRGLEVGLLDSDKRTRSAMVNAMIGMTTASVEASRPQTAELEKFLQQHKDFFTPTSRLRVRQLVVEGDRTRAQSAYQRLQMGESFAAVKHDFGKTVALSLPDTLLPPAKVREYLGPSAVQILQAEGAGFIAPPEPLGGDYRILVLVDKEIGQAQELADIRSQVEAEFVRRAGDRSLREYLQWLKGRADIDYPSSLPL
ncbi:hypothetical protein HBA55_27415 [Pseudomaricurvus alkylphenolicus]|uniref:peptidylprolyl isomerase n=1 Tax=Pseudomaricurvus alkylphenolicus TaxID=1306991 RepID=UPI00141D8033|nr:peptidylprolyl isomerase [Pseudomaricurvus alkylphenolicus]NIB43368.1 hypothetical protein [Pseudomaricurvus alkylphenolicus]